MKLRVFRIFVTCYLTCILCRNATAESIAKVSWSSNNTFQSDVRMFGIDSARIKRSTEIETRSTGIILKNDLIQPKTLQESPFAKNQTTEAKNLNSLKEAKCSRYCVQRLKTSKDVENVNLVLLFNDRNKGEINKKETVHEIVSKKRIRRNKASSVTDKTINKLESMKHETRKNIINNSTDLFKREFVFKRSADNFSDTSLYSRKSATAIDKNIINFFIHNNSLMSYGAFRILPNTSNIFKEEKIQARSSEVTSLNENNVDVKLESSVSDFIPMQIAESDQSQRLSTQINEEPFEKRKVLLELNPNSKLIAAPGTRHRVIFDATNNCVLPVRYAIQARSSPFRIINIQPIYMWLYPGQTDQVAVDILIPSASQDTVNTLTVNIVGTEISEKTVQVFVQNTLNKKVDNVKPTIEYWFNNNCAGKLDKDRCDKTVWSVDITVQDYDSGLKSVVAIPNRIYPVTKYISGTKDRVTFYYWSTCCTTTATITAIDIAENQYTRTIDVNVWDNLSQGEIAAIVLGVLLLLFLLILLVIAIVYCVRKRNSHDLPYTQRYGSRQPARSERTSF